VAATGSTLFAGIDVGAQSAKAAIFDGERMVGARVVVTDDEADAAARGVYDGLLGGLGLTEDDIESVFATGWGARDVSFADRRSSEQVCAALAARWEFEAARTVLDMGAEACRAMKLDASGTLQDFANNSKCASGTGAFIELGADFLGVGIEEMGPLSLAADGAADVSTTCAVFAESVIISHIHAGETAGRIAAGVHRSAATRAHELLGRIAIVEDLVMVGGAALNRGLVQELERMVEVPIRVPERPRAAVALGAAIQAERKSRRKA
jgi:predicted CoA-substrate-specific enzyme activase